MKLKLPHTKLLNNQPSSQMWKRKERIIKFKEVGSDWWCTKELFWIENYFLSACHHTTQADWLHLCFPRAEGAHRDCFLCWRWTTSITRRQNRPWLTEEKKKKKKEKKKKSWKNEEEAERAEEQREVATLFPSHVRGASKSPLSKKPIKIKIICSVFSEGAKKNHFVSLTFVACFYFLIVLFFSLTVCFTKKTREASASVLYRKYKISRDALITNPDDLQKTKQLLLFFFFHT